MKSPLIVSGWQRLRKQTGLLINRNFLCGPGCVETARD
jgi:hypothetical protein